MRNTITLLLLMIASLAFAQTTYDIEIERDATNTNLYTVFAVPSAAESGISFVNGGLGFAIATGETIGNITSITGANWNTDLQTFTGAQLQSFMIGDGTRDVIFLLSDTGDSSLSHGADERFDLLSFEVTSSPTAGAIEFLEPTDPLITGLGGLGIDAENFINIDFGSGTVESFGQLVGDTNFNLVLSAEDFILSKTSVFPNPIVDTFNIKAAGISIDNAQIYNINGALVKTISADVIDNAIDISELNSGVYFLQLTSGNSKSTVKLLKQ